MADVSLCRFVRACLRDNILPLFRLRSAATAELDAIVLKAVENIELEKFTRISASGVASQVCTLLEKADYPVNVRFFQETSKWRRLNHFGIERAPVGVGMVPILLYRTNHFVVAELVREALRCYEVLHQEDLN